jgi:hypothetical protein
MRFHLGEDLYLLNFWNFPVTGPHPEVCGVQFALVKILLLNNRLSNF